MLSKAIKRSKPCGTSALISGAGVGGLVAALELWRRGCDVRIFEKTKTSRTGGDTFQIGPSAMKMLKNWPEMEHRHNKILYEPLFTMSKQTGERRHPPIEMSTILQKGLPKEDSGPPLRVFQHERPKFHSMLLEQLEKCGLEVEFGKEVVGYYEDAPAAKGGVVLKDGSKHDADLVVASDGLQGYSWSVVADGQPVPAKSSGAAIFRSAYPVELAIQDPVIAERFKLQENGRSVFELWVGENIFATFWRNNEHMMWSITHPDHGTAEESWSNRVKPEVVLDFTSTIPNWSEVADRVIKATPPDSLIDWKLMWRNPQPKWTSPGGYVVQLGDTAHTFLPSSGNGGTQAIEDAVSLAACIAIAGNGRVPDATRVHNLLRFERVSFLQAVGVARQGLRLKSGSEKPKEPPMPGRWLMDHDAEEYAEEKYEQALAHLNDGTPFQNTNRPSGVEYRPWTIDGLVDALEKGEPTILEGNWN